MGDVVDQRKELVVLYEYPHRKCMFIFTYFAHRAFKEVLGRLCVSSYIVNVRILIYLIYFIRCQYTLN